jgi:hypothetical protein
LAQLEERVHRLLIAEDAAERALESPEQNSVRDFSGDNQSLAIEK